MAIERNLPENRQQRVDAQLRAAEQDVVTIRGALEFAQKSFVGKLQGHAIDPVTVHQQRLLVKCLESDLHYAERLEAAARRIWCEFNNIDPDDDSDGGTHEDPNDYVGNGWIGSDGRP